MKNRSASVDWFIAILSLNTSHKQIKQLQLQRAIFYWNIDTNLRTGITWNKVLKSNDVHNCQLEQ